MFRVYTCLAGEEEPRRFLRQDTKNDRMSSVHKNRYTNFLYIIPSLLRISSFPRNLALTLIWFDVLKAPNSTSYKKSIEFEVQYIKSIPVKT